MFFCCLVMLGKQYTPPPNQTNQSLFLDVVVIVSIALCDCAGWQPGCGKGYCGGAFGGHVRIRAAFVCHGVKRCMCCTIPMAARSAGGLHGCRPRMARASGSMVGGRARHARFYTAQSPGAGGYRGIPQSFSSRNLDDRDETHSAAASRRRPISRHFRLPFSERSHLFARVCGDKQDQRFPVAH